MCKQAREKYFVAVLKGGHVTPKYYIEFNWYIKAESKKAAAEMCRHIPRVKRNHSDFIISLTEICYEEFCMGVIENKKDPYLSCKNKQEQNMILEQIESRIKPDPHYIENPRRKKAKTSTRTFINRYMDKYEEMYTEWKNGSLLPA